MDGSAQIAARWGYIFLWAEAMEDWYGKPPLCLSWLEFAFYCYYGPDNLLWPDPTQRNTGNGPAAGLLQSCALALLEGPDILLAITERRAMHTYAEEVKKALDKPNVKVINNKSSCKHFMPSNDHCILNGRYKKCPFRGDKLTCDVKGIKDEQ